MADGFEYFTSGDAGAPILHGAVGRMIAVLDWVLVSKGGWEKVYTGTDLAAYRSLTGNRFYLAADDTQSLYCRLRGYQAMSDVSTGTGSFPPNVSAAPAGVWGVGKSANAGTSSAPRRYWGVRSNRYVFMIVELHPAGQDGSQRCAFAFGDVPSLCEADLFNTVIMGWVNAHTVYFPTNYVFNSRVDPRSGMNVTSAGVSMAATPNGSLAAPVSSIVTPAAPPTGHVTADASAAFASGRLQYMTPEVWSQQNSFGASSTPCYARARLPNCRMGASVLPVTGLADLEIITEGARQFLLIGAIVSSTTSYAFSMLEITDTDGML